MASPTAFATLAKLHQQMADVYAELAAEAEGRMLAHDRLERMALATVIATLDAQDGDAPAA